LCQFHQCFTHAFFVRKSFWHLFGSISLVTFSFVIFGAKILYENRAHKMLMKLTPRVNFINILGAAFVPVDPKSVKKY